MTDGFEVFMGIVVSFMAMCLIGLGYAIAHYQITNHCKKFGAFEYEVIYECKEKSK